MAIINVVSKAWALRVSRLAGKGSFFFWVGIYVVEWMFGSNPYNTPVTGTKFSIAYYSYITFFDVLHFFWIGIIIISVGAILFAFSKYKYLPLIAIAFGVAFYFEIMNSIPLMVYYKSTYACHTITTRGGFEEYICPLQSLVDGHPTIFLQGDVITPIAVIVSSASWAVSRLYAGAKVAIAEMVIAGAIQVWLFELGQYLFQSYWMDKQVTYYQRLLYLENFTNNDLWAIASTVLAIFAILRMRLAYSRGVKKEQESILKEYPTVSASSAGKSQDLTT